MITVDRMVGDTLTPLGAHLWRKDTNGDAEDIDVTSLTVKFKMVSEAGGVKVAETDSNVSNVTASEGKVQYDFQPTDVDTAGVYFAWFTAYSGTEKLTCPKDGRTYKIILRDTV